MAEDGKTQRGPGAKPPKMPRGFWTMKPVTKVKESGKAEQSKKACRDKRRPAGEPPAAED